ncbi:hypothetical protein PLICRDRAFT_569911 [Plicaturopsis crispa FD-325 SS-3]|nr:hypothetical protein PLICRDRAFT_569911 [Plicaturopsis crispa FD-325 SS-3]
MNTRPVSLHPPDLTLPTSLTSPLYICVPGSTICILAHYSHLFYSLLVFSVFTVTPFFFYFLFFPCAPWSLGCSVPVHTVVDDIRIALRAACNLLHEKICVTCTLARRP